MKAAAADSNCCLQFTNFICFISARSVFLPFRLPVWEESTSLLLYLLSFSRPQKTRKSTQRETQNEYI
jgi:hypothetical protein